MEVSILAVGKLRSYYREACEAYAGRLRRFATVDEREIREGRGGTGAEIERDEARRMSEKLPQRAILVALMATPEWAVFSLLAHHHLVVYGTSRNDITWVNNLLNDPISKV